MGIIQEAKLEDYQGRLVAFMPHGQGRYLQILLTITLEKMFTVPLA